MCGALRASDSGKKAVLMGWVNRRRDLGNLIFVDVRDRTGVTQVVCNKENNPALHEKASQLRNEYVIAVIGTVKLRDSNTINKNIPSGEVELVAEELRILNESKQPQFLPGDTVLANEELRLKYRYIDLRRDAMQHNIELRHHVAIAIRDYLSAQGFFEIETPFMTRSTPEGARDYLVPSRVQPGSFYALPQSPQLFKQILMISGFDKYFQIVRCFRDEDLRADRQPEFTQIDLEMSYPQQERVWEVVEGFLTAAFKAGGYEIKTPFPRMSYDEAVRLYGSDKPDMRLPAMVDLREAFTPEELEKFQATFKVGPEILVAETAHDLEIPVESRDHQNLLEQLRRLRQRVETPRLHPAGHQVVARAFGRGARHERSFDLEKSLRRKIVANGQRNLVPQLDILLHGIAAQIKIAIFEPHFLIGQYGFTGQKRRLLRFVEDAQFFGDQFHLAGGDILVYCVGNPLLGRSHHGDDILVAQRLSLLVNGRIALLVKHDLSDATTVAYVNKDQVAKIAPPVHPTHEHCLLARIRRTQNATHVCTS